MNQASMYEYKQRVIALQTYIIAERYPSEALNEVK